MSHEPPELSVVDFLRHHFDSTHPTEWDEYNVGLAYLTTVLSTWSYADEQPMRWVIRRHRILGRELEKKAIKKYEVRNSVLQVDATGYLISFDEDFHVLVFRGTEPTHWVDIWTDALVWMRDWNDGTGPRKGTEQQLLHEGFFLSFDVLWPQIAEDLRMLKGKLVVTGHSLGGAMALITGRALQDNRRSAWDPPRSQADDPKRERPTTFGNLTLCGIYTYGQPMVCNKKFANESNFKLYRHVYARDVVPRVPPSDLAEPNDPNSSFVHYGCAYVNKAKELWEPDANAHEVATLPQFVRSFWALITARIPAFKDRHPVELVWYILANDAKGTHQATLLEKIRELSRMTDRRAPDGMGVLRRVSQAIEGKAWWNEARDGTLDLMLPPALDWLVKSPLEGIYQAVQRLSQRPRLDWKLEYSFEDHIPSHYVEVSRNSWLATKLDKPGAPYHVRRRRSGTHVMSTDDYTFAARPAKWHLMSPSGAGRARDRRGAR